MDILKQNSDRLKESQIAKIKRVAQKKRMTQAEAHRYIIDKFRE